MLKWGAPSAAHERGRKRLWENSHARLKRFPHFTEEHDKFSLQGLVQPGAVNGGINWYRANTPPLEEIKLAHCWPLRSDSTSFPGMLIWGDKDQIFVATLIDDFPKYVENLHLQRIPDAGHSLMLESPDTVTDLLYKFRGLVVAKRCSPSR